MTSYHEIAEKLRACSTHQDLRTAWREVQQDMRHLPPVTRTWLTGLKDQRKRLIEEGGIEDYDAARARCDAIDWADRTTRESVMREVAMDRARRDLEAARGSRRGRQPR